MPVGLDPLGGIEGESILVDSEGVYVIKENVLTDFPSFSM